MFLSLAHYILCVKCLITLKDLRFNLKKGEKFKLMSCIYKYLLEFFDNAHDKETLGRN